MEAGSKAQKKKGQEVIFGLREQEFQDGFPNPRQHGKSSASRPQEFLQRDDPAFEGQRLRLVLGSQLVVRWRPDGSEPCVR